MLTLALSISHVRRAFLVKGLDSPLEYSSNWEIDLLQLCRGKMKQNGARDMEKRLLLRTLPSGLRIRDDGVEGFLESAVEGFAHSCVKKRKTPRDDD